MDKKNLMSQALQLVNRTTSPNLLAELSEEASDIQELSEEVSSQVWGGGQWDLLKGPTRKKPQLTFPARPYNSTNW